MAVDTTFWLYTITILIYGSICIISIILTFSVEQYYKLDEILKLGVVFTKIFSPLELETIDIIDEWLLRHHKIVGPLLACLSLIDIKLLFDIIYKL